MKINCLPVVGGLFLLSALSTPLYAKNVALLIGVGDYQSPLIKDLKGPPHDVAALQKVLVDRWGFAAKDVHTLIDRTASKRAILSQIEQLQERSTPGDQVLIYFSGHGTSPRDSVVEKARLPIPYGSGAIIPWDGVSKGTAKQIADSMIIGRTDVLPRLERLDQSGRNLLVIYDSCFSGNAVRGVHAGKLSSLTRRPIAKRYTPPIFEDDDEESGDHEMGGGPSMNSGHTLSVGRQVPPYPYNNTYFISAASDHEKADDISQSTASLPTFDGNPHGAFSDALLRILNDTLAADSNRNGAIDHLELRQAIAGQLATNGHAHHPRGLPGAREDVNNLAQRSLFGSGGMDTTPFKATPYRVQVAAGSRQLQERLKNIAEIELVSSGVSDLVILAAESGWLLTNGAGDKIGDADSAAAVEGRVRQMAWFHRLMQRQAGKNPFRFELGLERDGSGITLQKYEFLNYRLYSEKDSWVVLLYIDSTGQMAPLYPYLSHEVKLAAAGKDQVIPGGNELPGV